MSRGLGAQQRAVIEHLKERGQWDKAENIAIALYRGRANYPPHAFMVSIRRAINTLAQRGDIRAGHHIACYWPKITRRATKHELVCWLPDQATPWLDGPVLKSAVVEAAIVNIIRGGFPWDDEIQASHYLMRDDPSPPRDEVPYEWLSNQVKKRFSAFSWSLIHCAISKAMRKLIAKGMIEARGVYLGRNRHMTIRLVRLIGS
jgi:hypothetical protein